MLFAICFFVWSAVTVRTARLIEARLVYSGHARIGRDHDPSTMMSKLDATLTDVAWHNSSAYKDPCGVISDANSSYDDLTRYFAEFLLPIPRPGHVDSDVEMLHHIARMHNKFHHQFGKVFLPEYPLAHVKLTTSYPATEQTIQDRMLSFDEDYNRFEDAGVSVRLIKGGVGISDETVKGTRTANFMYNLPCNSGSKRNVTILEEIANDVRMKIGEIYEKWNPACDDEAISKLTSPMWKWSGNKLSLFSIGIPGWTSQRDIIKMNMQTFGKYLGQLGDMLTPTIMERVVSEVGASLWVLHHALDRDQAFLHDQGFRPSEALFRVGGIPYQIEGESLPLT